MSKLSKFLVAIVAVILIIIFAFNIFGFMNNRITTQVASLGKIEKNIDADGYIIRDEYIIVSKIGCFIDSMVSEGERVSKNEVLATVYEDASNAAIHNDIKTLNERIMSLEKLIMAEGGIQDVQDTDNFLKSKVTDVIEYSHRGNGNILNEVYYELINNIDENTATDNNSIQNLINELKSEKEQLESQLMGEKTTIVADSAGLYFSYADGYETLLYPEMIPELSVSAFNQLPDGFENSEDNKASAKLVTGYDWYYSFVADASLIDDFDYAAVITLNFDEHTDEDIKAYVYNISEEENGKCVITCRIEKYVHHAFTNRKLSATVILDSTDGLKIPREAIRVVDGQTGVYISKQSIARFRSVNILAQDENYVIVSPGQENSGELMIYDEVIIKGNIEKDGQSLE
ncbi:MAG: hypothetical protein J6A69_10305 [Clostridia bacterium]|nr:hypothetical protein [Clostridia bacterium]